MKRERIVMVRLVSEKDGVQVYECGVCHQTFTDNSDKGGDEHGFDEALSHYVNVHETAQIESDEPRAIVNSNRSDKTMRNQAEIEALKDELDELSEKALELPPEVYELIKELRLFPTERGRCSNLGP